MIEYDFVTESKHGISGGTVLVLDDAIKECKKAEKQGGFIRANVYARNTELFKKHSWAIECVYSRGLKVWLDTKTQ